MSKHRLSQKIYGFLFFICSSLNAFSQKNERPKQYSCQYTAQEILIDGHLEEDDWRDAPWTDLFVDIEGDLKPKPLQDTKAKLLWDDSCLYIAAVIYEEDIWAYQTIKDQIVFYENDFEVFIDPDGDTYNYFEMEVNAVNNTFDLFLPKPYRQRGKPDHDYDMEGFRSAISIKGTLNDPSDRDSLWVLEMAIPFSALRYGEVVTPVPKEGTTWRLNFSRVNWETEIEDGRYVRKKDPQSGEFLPEYNWVWSPQGVIDMHQPEKWGRLQFTKRNSATHP
ncbi:carbohydrate-binding family 9-like protein [Olivibacter sp. SDN3]|uniref:carbohydrate-binding family 9-like protein n=1 Tax=Olivibacter sp. SDN3 TaxID=2764720 RepID=UPI001C9E5528|nr:carbohydrate-binding family 9-like protein [Olivibacter sp. SDN3]